jgi:Queuosine salvage protein
MSHTQRSPGRHGLRENRLAAAGALVRDLGIDVSDSALVGIDELALGKLAAMLAADPAFRNVRRFGWDDDNYWLVDASPSERSQYLALGNAINFRFWSLDEGVIRHAVGQRGGTVLQGSLYMWRSLRLCVANGSLPVLDARFLSRITSDELSAVFRSDSGPSPIEIAFEDRLANLRDLGTRLTGDWEGQFANLVKASDHDLTRFARYSSQLRAFDDPICKLTMVNAIMHTGSGLVEFNQDPLPGIDYELVRQLLRMGILRPRHDIDLKLRSAALLNARESGELRRSALSALIQLSEMSGLPCDVLDNKLWMNRTNCTDATPVCQQVGGAHKCPFEVTCEQITELGMPLEETRYY